MRSICVVTQQFGKVVSGIGLHSRNVVTSLLRDDYRVVLVAPKNQRPAGDLPFRFVEISPPLFENTQARWLSLAWSFARSLAPLVREGGLDLVHFTDARESLFSTGLNIPVVGNVNDTYAAEVKGLVYYRKHYTDWLLRWTYYQLVKRCESIALPRLDAIIANSQHTARTISRLYRVKTRQLHVCYKSIDPELYSREAPRSKEESPPHVLFAGGNMQRKGLRTLIRAARRVLEEVPSAEFWIVGEDAAQAELKQACRAADVDRQFRFMGWKRHAEMTDLYRQASVFVMPSLEEAFGVVFLEAMASGVPVIGTRVGGIPELINDGENGLLVNPDDPQDLSQALLMLLESCALQEQLGEAGKRRAQQFDVDRMMRCTYEVYEDVLS